MFAAIFRALDRLVLTALPRRLLVIALDGVAPRAKMNQQRARRFLAARERGAEAAAQVAAACAWGVPPPDEPFDHNAITPGTEFMTELGAALRHFLAHRVATSRAYASLSILLSDAGVAGEGEHKIAAIVREQRAQDGYDPDSTHLLYGLDADLIMIGLAFHERHVYILRDWVPLGRQRFIESCAPRGCFPSARAALDRARSGPPPAAPIPLRPQPPLGARGPSLSRACPEPSLVLR